MIFLSLLVAATLLEVVADIFFKKWSSGNRQVLAAAGFGLYVAGTVFWAMSLRYDYLARAISIFTVLNLIAVTMVGVLMFGERLSLLNKIGIALGLLSVLFIEA